MIPISLVTGFLGSGKTTLLQKLVADNRSRRLVYLVNEFSSLDVDGGLLEAAGANVIGIQGGSIFCRCLVTQFMAELRGIVEKFHQRDAPLEGVVIEASGMANPRVMGQMLRETRLDEDYRLASIVTVVDPGSFLKLVHTLPAIKAQVESADIALLNKTDVHSEEAIRATEEALREINPKGRIIRCVFCDADLPLFEKQSAGENLEGEYAPCRDPHFEAVDVVPPLDLDLRRFETDVATLESDVYRIKGIVRASGRLYSVDYSKGRLTIQPAAKASSNPQLSFVLKGRPSDGIRRFLARLESVNQ